jgi:hypothetical protein
MHRALMPLRIRAAGTMCLTAAILYLAVCAFYLGMLFLLGEANRPLDNFAVLCRILMFPLFLVSLASLRWACVLLWANSILVLMIGVAASWPTPNVSLFNSGEFWLQMAATCLVTGAFLLLSKGRWSSDDNAKIPTLITLLRRDN